MSEETKIDDVPVFKIHKWLLKEGFLFNKREDEYVLKQKVELDMEDLVWVFLPPYQKGDLVASYNEGLVGHARPVLKKLAIFCRLNGIILLAKSSPYSEAAKYRRQKAREYRIMYALPSSTYEKMLRLYEELKDKEE